MPYWIVQASGSPGSCCAAHPRRRWWSALCSRTSRWRSPLLLQPTPPEQPAPERPVPEQPAPDQPLHPLLLRHPSPYLQRCADGATNFSSTQHLLSGDVTPPEDQRSPSADQGFPQRTSGTSYEPVCANPNPAVACASAPPVLAAFMQPSLPPCGRCRPSCGPRRLHAALALRQGPHEGGEGRMKAARAA